MDQEVAHTDALIPKWCVYDEKQSLTFVSPRNMEAYFVENTGIVDIPYNYVNRLNTLLDRMHDTIMATMTEREYMIRVYSHNFINEIVNVQLDLHIGSSVYLSLIEVRPCAEGLGIFRIVLWQLLQTCKCGGWKLGVGNPFPKTRQLLQRVAKEDLFQSDGEGGMIIQAQDILKCDIRNFDILDKLLICGLEAHKLTLNRKSFPYADVMNIHQDQLDRRLEHKLANNKMKPISEKKRRQALAEDRRVRAAQSVDSSLLLPALEKPCRERQNLRNYFGDFSNFLLRIRQQFGVYADMYRTNFRAFYDADKLYVERCKVAQCKISFGVDTAATLHVLDILDVLSADVQNLILWQILQCCYDAGLDFKMGLCTINNMVGIRVFKTKTDDGRFWIISRDDIGRLPIENFNILDKIYDGYDEDFPISVNPRESRFPTEDDLYRALHRC